MRAGASAWGSPSVTLAFDARPPNVRFAARPCCSGLAVRTAARDEHGPIVGAATYPSPALPALGTHTPPTASTRTPEPRSMTSGGLAWWPGGPASRLCACVPPQAETALTPEGTAHSSPGARGPGRDEAVALALGGLKPRPLAGAATGVPKAGVPRLCCSEQLAPGAARPCRGAPGEGGRASWLGTVPSPAPSSPQRSPTSQALLSTSPAPHHPVAAPVAKTPLREIPTNEPSLTWTLEPTACLGGTPARLQGGRGHGEGQGPRVPPGPSSPRPQTQAGDW